MNEEIESYLSKYDAGIKNRVHKIYNLILKSAQGDINERMWAKLPSFYSGNKFIRIIPFGTHINIEAEGLSLYKKELSEYKFTEKGMLQIYNNEELPEDELKKAFKSTFECSEYE